MDTCTNCGATLRPGAKFCTTCGTRLNSTTKNDGWNQSESSSPVDAQETSVMEAMPPAEVSESAAIDAGGTDEQKFDRWISAFSKEDEPHSQDDPASRFISALDQDTHPSIREDSTEQPPAPDPMSTWVTPPPDAFASPPATNRSFDSEADEKSDVKSESSDWQAPSTWSTVETSTETETRLSSDFSHTPTDQRTSDDSENASPGGEVPQAIEATITDSAGFSDDGSDEVDYLSGDENIDVSGPEELALDPADARAQAIALVDELRRVVRMMPGDGEQDQGAAAMALVEASLGVSDFADLRSVLVELQEDPRDIQALSSLAARADRMEVLLDEHAALAEAIEKALKELSSFQT